ncbi:MAG: TetR/AcrR family transcriptional regulator [Candidatus Obscuribacter sp.]|nr:TetR/AcrR family transcriptional regulator [Candidatus Obscuribacter sp.]
MSRREKKREETRQQILNAAARLFSQRGYDDSSVDDIAEEADVAKGTLYYNFKSKEEIVLALRHQSFDILLQQAKNEAEQGQPPLIVIEHFLICQSAWAEEHKDLARVLYGQGPIFPKPAPGKNAKGMPAPPPFFFVFTELVRAAQANGDLRADLDAEFIAHLFGFTGMHSNISWTKHNMEGSAVESVLKNFRALLAGLTPVNSNKH